MTLKAVQTPVSPPVSDTEIYALPTSPKSVPQKRKVDDGDGDGDEITATESGAKIESSSTADLDGLSAGRIICETCGEAVTFRDPQSGKLQIEKWDAHKQQCITGDATIAATAAAPRDSVSDTSEVNPSADTESESDATDAERPVNLPPVASIVTSTTAYSQGKPHDMQPPLKRRRAKRTEEERIEYLRSDPYVAHFEPYRVLCSSCDKWIRLRPNSTYCSIPWDAHRKSCLAKKGGASAPPGARNIAFSNDPQVKKFDAHRVHCRSCSQWIFVGADDSAIEAWTTHRAECEQTMVNSVSTPATSTASVPPPSKEQLAFVSMTVSSRSGSMPPPHVLSPRPASPAPPDKSTAEILAAAQAHAQNQPSSGGQESRRRNADQRAAILRQDPLLAEVEPHRVYCSLCQKWVQLRQDSTYCANPWQQHRAKCIIRADKKGRKARDFSARTSGTVGMLSAATFTVNGSRPSDVDTDCTSQGDPMEVDISTARSTPRSASGHALADLDTPAGRAAFVQRSITHLYSTTYERSDDLTLAALLAYLNCAVPLDKHEDFDTAEVLSAATALQARGVLELRGDILRPIFVD